MKILGISGAFGKPEKDFLPEVPIWLFHDSTAALLIDGQQRYVVEEERLNREKHTTKFAVHAIEWCLKQAGVSFNEVDKIVYNSLESFVDQCLNEQYLRFPAIKARKGRELFIELFQTYFDPTFNANKLIFVKHHLCHAYSAYFDSGFKDALVCIIDGQGEKESFSIYDVRQGNFHLLYEFSNLHSLGNFYVESIRLLAYYFFDEYKVMGLAPYGNPAKYRDLFKQLYELLPEGKFELKRNKIRTFLESGFVPRRKGEPFNQQHKDFAAALQEMIETIILHVIAFWQKQTKHTHLCIAGGVGHNCTLNGLIAYSDMFKHIFVHPASNDSGAALGAALYIAHQENDLKTTHLISDVYWGPDVGKSEEIEKELQNWKDLLKYERKDDICNDGAALIAQGNVIGWAQGKMEFGPRALGNRSILADPRPKENKDRINAMVKKREGYRPFAPSVLEEKVHTYFAIPDCQLNLDFMVFNLRVREEVQNLLGATTHINGTSRVQTVNKNHNPKYWRLIEQFEAQTGVAVLLNTSFNNMAEPIVSSVHDIITCFLTTGLDYLIIEDYLISKTSSLKEKIENFNISLVPSAVLKREKVYGLPETHEIYFHHRPHSAKTISKEMHNYLLFVENDKQPFPIPFSASFIDEIFNLWAERYIALSPLRLETKFSARDVLKNDPRFAGV